MQAIKRLLRWVKMKLAVRPSHHTTSLDTNKLPPPGGRKPSNSNQDKYFQVYLRGVNFHKKTLEEKDS